MSFKKGQIVRVKPHTWYQHLHQGAIIKPPIERQHNGFERVVIREVYVDGQNDDCSDHFAYEVEFYPGAVAGLFPEEYIEAVTHQSTDAGSNSS